MFLLPSTLVIPTLAQDYPEWHKGRSVFCLWYLEIYSPALLEYLELLRTSFSDLLFQPNTRQFHITLFICGFQSTEILHDDDISQVQINNQAQQLKALQLQPFKLSTSKINSFQSALFLEVHDVEQVLPQIREQLGINQSEISPLQYCPHITIGLFGHEFNSDLLFQRISTLSHQHFEFDVRQVTFGGYVAQQLQGPLIAQQQIQLGII